MRGMSQTGAPALNLSAGSAQLLKIPYLLAKIQAEELRCLRELFATACRGAQAA
jgi:hypothetical protein